MSETSAEELLQFITVMKAYTPYDFSDYSDKSLNRRLSKLLYDNHMNLPKLIEEIKKDSDFVEKIVKDITVNTSEMFRDPQVWRAFQSHILPSYKGKQINIWHSGCSTGQEVYSLMILLHSQGMLDSATIYASDINEDVIEGAKKGFYKYRFNVNYITNFDAALNDHSDGKQIKLSDYLEIDKIKDSIKVHDFLTKKPIYQKHDLVKEPNIFNVEFDIIFCRNVIIYFNTNLQNKVFNLFYNSLKPNGCLVLGLHETILGPFAGNFEKRNQFFYFKK